MLVWLQNKQNVNSRLLFFLYIGIQNYPFGTYGLLAWMFWPIGCSIVNSVAIAVVVRIKLFCQGCQRTLKRATLAVL